MKLRAEGECFIGSIVYNVIMYLIYALLLFNRKHNVPLKFIFAFYNCMFFLQFGYLLITAMLPFKLFAPKPIFLPLSFAEDSAI